MLEFLPDVSVLPLERGKMPNLPWQLPVAFVMAIYNPIPNHAAQTTWASTTYSLIRTTRTRTTTTLTSRAASCHQQRNPSSRTTSSWKATALSFLPALSQQTQQRHSQRKPTDRRRKLKRRMILQTALRLASKERNPTSPATLPQWVCRIAVWCPPQL